VDVRSSTATASSVSIRLSGLDTVIYIHARVLHIINCSLLLVERHDDK
jgi:hypothetical protein